MLKRTQHDEIIRDRSDREARSAAAARSRIGIFDLERRSAERIDEIDDAAAHQVNADRIDDQLHPVGLGDDVIGVDALGKAEAIGEARTAAAVDREAERRLGIALAGRDPADARRSGRGQANVGNLRGHGGKIGGARSNEKGAPAVYCGAPLLSDPEKPYSGPPIASFLLPVIAAIVIESDAQKGSGLTGDPSMRTS